jgi:hypothetical protein
MRNVVMSSRQKTWVYNPKTDKPNVPEVIKQKIETLANQLVKDQLKERYVEKKPKKKINYIVDVYTKWHKNCFYFCAKYCSQSEYAMAPFFEIKFARMEYKGKNKYNLAYMRHTGQWWELEREISLNKAVKLIENGGHYSP